MILKEAAEQLGITPDTLRQQIKAGRLRAVKQGRDWWLEPDEVDRYSNEQLGQPGRKGGRKDQEPKRGPA